MIEARNLSRSFNGLTAVADLSFSVPEGKLCAILGPNGAGKTTTIRMLLGLIPMSGGAARVAGIDLPAGDRGGAELRSRVGLLTETPGFYDRISGRANLELFGRLYGLEEATIRARSEQWLRRLELWDARDRPFATWSKGMKQRLALIRAVLHEPPVIFLDEPTSGLDPAVARDVRSLIAGFRAEGRTILLCTHNLQEAEQLADLIGVMRRRMLVFGPRAELTAGEPRLTLELEGEGTALAAPLGALPGVRSSVVVQSPGAERRDPAASTILRLTLDDLNRDTPAVVREAVRLGAAIRAVAPERTSLEEIYLRAVGEAEA
jgi:ABC-2 type transport system ATP-binding protein